MRPTPASTKISRFVPLFAAPMKEPRRSLSEYTTTERKNANVTAGTGTPCSPLGTKMNSLAMAIGQTEVSAKNPDSLVDFARPMLTLLRLSVWS
jgi:hypothetical protein